jgi:hypothetical protein
MFHAKVMSSSSTDGSVQFQVLETIRIELARYLKAQGRQLRGREGRRVQEITRGHNKTHDEHYHSSEVFPKYQLIL